MKESEKQVLINTINSSGAILEEQLISVLSKCRFGGEIEKNKTFTFQDERIEIDCLLSTYRLHFLFECKRSLYSFYFLRSSDYRNAGYLIQQNQALKTIEIPPQGMAKAQLKVFPYCLEMLEHQGAFQRAKKGKVEFAPEQAERAGREEILHSFTRQTLKNLEAYIWLLHQKKEFISEITTFFPVIVTNAKLYSMEFSFDQIDPDGNLKDFSNYKHEKLIGFNFSDSVKWMGEQKEIVTDKNSFEKTVFIVNINHVSEFLERIKTL